MGHHALLYFCTPVVTLTVLPQSHIRLEPQKVTFMEIGSLQMKLRKDEVLHVEGGTKTEFLVPCVEDEGTQRCLGGGGMWDEGRHGDNVDTGVIQTQG